MILIKKYIEKAKDFKIKLELIFKNSEYLPIDDSIDITLDKVELNFNKETIISKNNINLINYLAEQLYLFIKVNDNSNDNLKSLINNFVVDVIKDQYYSFFIDYKTVNTFFDKQLLAINYKAPYDKKLISDSLIEDKMEVLEDKDDGELNPDADEDLSAMINDIDVDVDKDDIDEDGDMDIPEDFL